jgi:hypothetical protein|tara:strand:+ start:78 stop:431 length:354 start_codon:yes stop_codon:yes gene_type:complete
MGSWSFTETKDCHYCGGDIVSVFGHGDTDGYEFKSRECLCCGFSTWEDNRGKEGEEIMSLNQINETRFDEFNPPYPPLSYDLHRYYQKKMKRTMKLDQEIKSYITRQNKLISKQHNY